jgi:galactokinase/mevalonate kinase-like predicted kinase
MKNFKTTVIEKRSMEDMNWDVVIPRLEAKPEISNIILVDNKLTYEKTTELFFDAMSIDEAESIALEKTKMLSGFVSFTRKTEEVIELSAQEEAKKAEQNPVKTNELKLNAADAESYLYEMDMNGTDKIIISEGFRKKTVITREDVLNALPHLRAG